MPSRSAFALSGLVLLAGCGTASTVPLGQSGPPFPEAEVEVQRPTAMDLDALLREAAALITPETCFSHLSVLAHDSMMGRDTERPEI